MGFGLLGKELSFHETPWVRWNAQDSARTVPRFLEDCFFSLTIVSRAANAFPDAPRIFTLPASAKHIPKDTINIYGHNLLGKRTEHTGTFSCRCLKQAVQFKSQILRTENLQGFKILMKNDVNDPGCCKWSISFTAPSWDWPCFLVQTLFQLNIRIMNEMVVYYSSKLSKFIMLGYAVRS